MSKSKFATTELAAVDNDSSQPTAATTAAATTTAGFVLNEYQGGLLYTSDQTGNKLVVNMSAQAIELDGQTYEPASSSELQALYDLGEQYAYLITAPPGYTPPWEPAEQSAGGCQSC